MPEPKRGEVLVKVAYLPLDPYQRGRMRDAASFMVRRVSYRRQSVNAASYRIKEPS